MRTLWQWLSEPVEYVGLSDGIVAAAGGALVGAAVGALVKWLIS